MTLTEPASKVTSSSRCRKVLVLGDDTRSFLAVVRSLGRRGIEVHAAPFNFRAPALSSRYIRRIHRVRRFVGAGESWCEALAELLERERFDFVVPVDDRNVLAFQRYRVRLERLSTLAIPSDEAINVFYDKHRTRELAEHCQVPIAQGRLLEDGDTAKNISRELGLPVVVKPRRSYTLESLHDRGKVVLVETERAFDSLLDNVPRRSDYLVESVFRGSGVGISVLAGDGKLIHAFEHHRVSEVPLGGSSFRVSAPLDAERLAACQRMLARLFYTGVAMFEFRHDFDTGAWVLLEVNARFWGSLPLPLSLGIDFPRDLLRVLSHEAVTPKRTYEPGVLARNLFSDLHATSQHIPSDASFWRKGLAASGKLLTVIPRMVTCRERSDTFVRDDPTPGFVEVSRLARRTLEKTWMRRRRLLLSPKVRRARIRRAIEESRTDLPIVFLCQGNICRSPFAQVLLERCLRERSSTCPVTSAGLLPLPGRHCPPEAVRAARQHGIDLGVHTSRFFDEDWPAKSGVVFVFDRATLEDCRDRFPVPSFPLFLLSDVLDQRDPGEINDPLGRGSAVFDSTYTRVAEAVNELACLIR